ncbi:MAG: class I SAM-dependent methyltransferase [Myxococcota bacterium]
MPLQRFHFIEVADQSWCPRFLRDGLTDYLRHAESVMRPYDPVLPRLQDALARCGDERVLDLCSGAGGPWVPLLAAWEKTGGGPIEIRLSDQRTSPEAWARAAQSSGGIIRPHPEPIDARAVPKNLAGFRTLFAAFHHFRPDEAREIVRDAVRNRRGIAILEVTQRTPLAVLLACFSWLFVMILTPGIRPVRVSRLVFTYLVPLIPLLVTFDGVVSCLRSYTVDEFGAFAAEGAGDGYEWQIGESRYPGFPIPVTYAIGVPRPAPG